MLSAKLGRIREQLAPGNQNWSAEKIIDDVYGQFAVEKQDANRFPSRGDVDEQIFAIRSEDFSNLVDAHVVRQLDYATQRLRESWTLKRLDEREHCVAFALTTIIPNFRCRENHAGGDRDRVVTNCE